MLNFVVIYKHEYPMGERGEFVERVLIAPPDMTIQKLLNLVGPDANESLTIKITTEVKESRDA